MDNLSITYQDPWIIIVNKPIGLPTQSAPKAPVGLYEQLQKQFPYVGMHHRLDQPTSGLVLFSLSQSLNGPIAALFQHKEIQRRYAAVCAGTITELCTWATPLEGRKAVSHVIPKGHQNGLSAIQVQLDTGRTHQIRKHAAFHQNPIIGDRRYGDQWGGVWPRLALHAYQIDFRHPKTQKQICVEAPVPPDMTELWALAGGE